MQKEIIKTGKTIEDAVLAACTELGVPRDSVNNANITIIANAKKGFLGLGAVPAKVAVTVTIPDTAPSSNQVVRHTNQPDSLNSTARSKSKSPHSDSSPVPSNFVLVEPASPPEFKNPKTSAAVNFILSVLSAMNESSIQVYVKENDSSAQILFRGDELGVVIGRRGETLDSLQYITNLIANRLEGDFFKISINSGNFREKREETLVVLARKIAINVVKTGRRTTLEPMNPYERRIIHSTVHKIEGAASSSVGDEPHRRVVISPRVTNKPTNSSNNTPYNKD